MMLVSIEGRSAVGKGNRVHGGNSDPVQGGGGGLKGCPGCVDIVEEDHPFTVEDSVNVWDRGESIANVLHSVAACSRGVGLGRGLADSGQGLTDLNPEFGGKTGKGAGDQEGLIESPFPQSDRSERDRDDNGIVEHFADPIAGEETARNVRGDPLLTFVFQAHDEVSGRVVEEHGRTCPAQTRIAESETILAGGLASQPRERLPAAVADRIGDKDQAGSDKAGEVFEWPGRVERNVGNLTRPGID